MYDNAYHNWICRAVVTGLNRKCKCSVRYHTYVQVSWEWDVKWTYAQQSTVCICKILKAVLCVKLQVVFFL